MTYGIWRHIIRQMADTVHFMSHPIDLVDEATVTELPIHRTRPNMADPRVRAEYTPAALNGFRRLTEEWQLTANEASALLDVSLRTWHRIAKGGSPEAISLDMMTRISGLFGIYKGLRIVFSEPLATNWIKLPNADPLFAGQSALQFMTREGIPGILRVRQYVDAIRGGL